MPTPKEDKEDEYATLGKSQWVEDLARMLGLPCLVETLNEIDPTDIDGKG